jgi:nitroreductase
MGLLSPKSRPGEEALVTIDLPSPMTTGGLPLMEALTLRRSEREFRSTPLPYQIVSNLLWAAHGINRPESGGRTAPSAINCQEVEIYVVLAAGAYLYVAEPHSLQLVVSGNLGGAHGSPDFVDQAPLHLIYVANRARSKLIPVAHRKSFSATSAGCIAQNVHLFCASEGLSTVIRGWISRSQIKKALQLDKDDQILFAQTVGLPLSPVLDG